MGILGFPQRAALQCGGDDIAKAKRLSMRHLPGVLFIVQARTLSFLLIALRNKSHYVRRACTNYAGESR